MDMRRLEGEHHRKRERGAADELNRRRLEGGHVGAAKRFRYSVPPERPTRLSASRAEDAVVRVVRHAEQRHPVSPSAKPSHCHQRNLSPSSKTLERRGEDRVEGVHERGGASPPR